MIGGLATGKAGRPVGQTHFKYVNFYEHAYGICIDKNDVRNA